MLVNDRTTWFKLELEHEPGQWVLLRPLTAAEYQLCLDARSDATIKRFSDIDPAFFKSLQSDRPTEDINDDANRQIDVTLALNIAIQEWSYDADCNSENKAALDSYTSELIKDKIVDMNMPRNLSKGNGSNGSLSLIESYQPN